MNKKLLTKNFEDEIEQILENEGILGDGIVYEGANVKSVPRTGGNDELKKIVAERAMLFEDEKYFYVVMNDADLLELQGKTVSDEQRKFATDFSVDKLKKSQYGFLAEI